MGVDFLGLDDGWGCAKLGDCGPGPSPEEQDREFKHFMTFMGVVTLPLGFAESAGAACLSAAQRATELANGLGNSQRWITIAVTETKEGVRIISSSEGKLRPVITRMLKPGEIAGEGAGHAEVTGINAAEEMGLTPTGTAASRPICNACAQSMEKQGVAPLSPLKLGGR